MSGICCIPPDTCADRQIWRKERVTATLITQVTLISISFPQFLNLTFSWPLLCDVCRFSQPSALYRRQGDLINGQDVSRNLDSWQCGDLLFTENFNFTHLKGFFSMNCVPVLLAWGTSAVSASYWNYMSQHALHVCTQLVALCPRLSPCNLAPASDTQPEHAHSLHHNRAPPAGHINHDMLYTGEWLSGTGICDKCMACPHRKRKTL